MDLLYLDQSQSMKLRLKRCDGCGLDKPIWKNHQGLRYCKPCWFFISPSKPIKPRSEKRVKEESKYSKARKEYLADHPNCEARLIGCTQLACQIHHKKGRIGELLYNKKFFLAVCDHCHKWIEAHPEEAKEKGFSLNRL